MAERGERSDRSDRKTFLLRVDPRLHEAMARWAADDLRSVNAQIEYVLTAALRQAGREPRPSRKRPP